MSRIDIEGLHSNFLVLINKNWDLTVYVIYVVEQNMKASWKS